MGYETKSCTLHFRLQFYPIECFDDYSHESSNYSIMFSIKQSCKYKINYLMTLTVWTLTTIVKRVISGIKVNNLIFWFVENNTLSRTV